MVTIQNYPLKQRVKIRKNFFEKSLWEQGELVVGVDEVGRGCLAGPLVTAATILPIGKISRLLKDSKLLDEKKRLQAFKWIQNHCWYQIGIVHHRIIDKHNIWQATLLAMKRALVNLLPSLPMRPGAILVDAMPLNVDDIGILDIPVYHFIKGENYSSSIAAASIVAKVTRDQLMKQYDILIPGYKLEQHKGYATKIHQDSIRESGQSIIHRHSFLSAYRDKEQDDQCNQQTICRSS